MQVFLNLDFFTILFKKLQDKCIYYSQNGIFFSIYKVSIVKKKRLFSDYNIFKLLKINNLNKN
jgi:hypothetical protein